MPVRGRRTGLAHLGWRGVFAASALVLGGVAGCGRSELDAFLAPDPSGSATADGNFGVVSDDAGDAKLGEWGVDTGQGVPQDAASDGDVDAFGGEPDATADSQAPEDAGEPDASGGSDARAPDSGTPDSGEGPDSGASHDSGVPADGGSRCPAAYVGCHGATTAVPSSQAACSRDELRSARTECAAGAHASGCETFFASEQMQDPACGLCLRRFDFDFLKLRGIFACVAPFVDVGCNADTGCLTDCLDQSCSGCPDRTSSSDCKLSVSTGTCAPYVVGAKCVEGAFGNGGGFCDPEQYTTFGDWLRAVGEQFCGQ